MGEAKRRKQNDPNFGKVRTVERIKESLVVTEDEIRFTSSVGDVMLYRHLQPPNRKLNKKNKQPIDCSVYLFVLIPDAEPSTQLDGFCFTKPHYFSLAVLGYDNQFDLLMKVGSSDGYNLLEAEIIEVLKITSGWVEP